MDQELALELETISKVVPRNSPDAEFIRYDKDVTFKLDHEAHDEVDTTWWLDYCRAIRDRPDSTYMIGKKQQTNESLLVPMELSFATDTLQGMAFESDFTRAVVYCIQQALQESFAISQSKDELYTIACHSDGDIKNGNQVVYKLLFLLPYAYSRVEYFQNIFRPRLLTHLSREHVLKRLNATPLLGLESIIGDIKTDYVPLYGSVKVANDTYPVYSEFYPELDSEDIDDDPYEDDKYAEKYVFDNVFPTDKLKIVQDGVIDAEIALDEGLVEHLKLPLIMASGYTSKIMTRNASVVESAPSQAEKVTTITTGSIAKKIQKAVELTQMINPARFNAKCSWLAIGKAWYNVVPGDEKDEMLNEWTRFTIKNSNVFSKEHCVAEWPSFAYNNNNTKITLEYFAHQDNAEAYTKWADQRCRKYYENALDTLAHADVAMLLRKLLPYQYACTNASKKIWYEYVPKEHRWKKMDNQVPLKKYIITSLCTKVMVFRSVLSADALAVTDPNLKMKYDTRINNCSALTRKLKNSGYQSSVLTQCEIVFHQPEFVTKFDRDPRLTGIRNGVIEIVNQTAVPRQGHPEDFITKQMNASYEKSYTDDHPKVQMVRTWFRQVYNNPEIFNKLPFEEAVKIDSDTCKYVWNIHSSLLYGRNQDKKIYINEGPDGDNSKSKVALLMETALGDYYIKFPTHVLTQGSRGSGPTPELAQAQGARAGAADEPDEDEPIKGGLLKLYTGGDSFFARGLNENGGKVEPMFKFFLTCNRIPMIPTGGKAVKNRLRAIPHKSRWVENPPNSVIDQWKQSMFPRDNLFDEKIPQLINAYLWIIIKNYANYAKNGLSEPKEVTEYTKNYWEENDIFNIFIRENVQLDRDEATGNLNIAKKVHTSELYGTFKGWMQLEYEGVKIPVKGNFMKEFMSRCPARLNNTHVLGVSMLTTSRKPRDE